MKKMRKFLATILTGCMMMACVGCGNDVATENTTAEINTVEEETAGSEVAVAESDTVSERIKELQENGLVVGSNNDSPISYVDTETGEYLGLDAELIKEACRRLGITNVTMKTIPWDNLLIELQNGSVDMVSDGMYINAERSRIVTFSHAYWIDTDVLVVAKDSDIYSMDDLEGTTLGCAKGTAFYDQLVAWQEEGIIESVVTQRDTAESMMAVNTGKTDGCVMDSTMAGYMIKNDPSLNLRIVEDYEPVSVGYIGGAFRQDDTELIEAFNKVLDEMKEDGTVQEIMDMYGYSDQFFLDVEESIYTPE